MNIGFDAKRAFLNRTGLGNYSRWLINGLAKLHTENKYLLYTPKLSTLYAPKGLNTFVKTPTLRLFTSRWRASGIIRDLKRDEIDLYHGLSHELPFGLKRTGIKGIVTVHDVIFMRYPQYFKAIDRFFYKAKLKVACRESDRIVAMSQKTKDDIVDIFGTNPAKIEVIYQGCDPAFKVEAGLDKLEEVRKRYNLPEKYLLNVGTIEERKNLLLLERSLRNIPDIKLVVVGKITKYLDEVQIFIAQNQLRERVIFLHNVPFADLPAIYQGAACFIYPSRYEGFGIPILEALVSKVPVIAATGSCLEEAGGPDSIYVDPDDDRALAKAINSLLSDEQLRNKMIIAGLNYSANFDDEKLIQQYAKLYQQVLDHA
ncbi:glycosyltransferase family 4 protein [Mucilaginibacter ginkgonis]|uniref:Glycosyltransferase family 4 protein n=1 Tax=Mucilaginibacter ginkgonis TaxID=2682091 RepID=A0A6I4HX20_9SPHI|nr:glycosyltransferase family 1 protein [Mucilaginibacter ginkgonis]QQL48258.1 glycosyltransferase family 4 protein [Mucilaginibacter ginkgonis]